MKMIFKTREIRKKIIQMRNQGISDESILEKLSEEYGRKKVKEIISATAHIQDRSKHRLFVGILLLISMATIIFDVILEKKLLIFRNDSFIGLLLLSTIVMIEFVMERRYNRYVYMWIMLACVWIPLAFFLHLMILETCYLYATINLLSIITICVLSFCFQRKIFPKHTKTNIVNENEIVNINTFSKQSTLKNILFLGLGLFLFGLIINIITQGTYDITQSPWFKYLTMGGGFLFVIIFFAVLFVPIFEEFAFRFWTIGKTKYSVLSIILSTFFVYFVFQAVVPAIITAILLIVCFFVIKNNKLKIYLSIFTTSLIFTLLHVIGFSEGISMIFGMIAIFGFSLILCYLGLRYGFVYCILLHCVSNLIFIIFLMPIGHTQDILWENNKYQVIVTEQPSWEKSQIQVDDTLYFKGTKASIASEMLLFSNDFIYKPKFKNFRTYYVKVSSKNGQNIDRNQLFVDFVEKMKLQCDTNYVASWVLDVKDSVKLNYKPKEDATQSSLENKVVILRETFDLPIVFKQEEMRERMIYNENIIYNPLKQKKEIKDFEHYGIYLYEDTVKQVGVITIKEK